MMYRCFCVIFALNVFRKKSTYQIQQTLAAFALNWKALINEFCCCFATIASDYENYYAK